MNHIHCAFIDNFEKIYDKWAIQRKLDEGPVLNALGSEVIHINVLGRGYSGPEAEAPLGYGISLVEEPTNPVDPQAIAVYRDTDRIGYVPKNRTALVKRWMDAVREDEAKCVNSPKAIYFFRGQNLF